MNLAHHFEYEFSIMLDVFHSGSLSVNVSITSGKDEFVNAGQLMVSSSSSNVLSSLLPMGINAFLLQILALVGSLFL